MNKVSLALVIHSHQPVGNFDHVFEQAYQKAYAPFIRLLLRHPRIRMSLHYSGILLEWLEQRHSQFFKQLRELITRGQVELMGGGYFEPILPAIPDGDKLTQVRKLADYLQDRLGVNPQGAWVAERVWEPNLVGPLAQAGVEYTILDDTHFLAAGLEPSELRGSYVTEDCGALLRLVPSSKALRYSIPFREPQETLNILREGIGKPSSLFAMGDDCEKFGVWPGTFEHCYVNGWLERFLSALEDAREWLDTTTLSDFLSAHLPLGRVYLPTASYAEMMEWALPFEASCAFKACWEETERMPGGERFRRFLRGGSWRNFLSKYAEANQLHKLMLAVSQRLREAAQTDPRGEEQANLLHQARTHALAAQCNDAYWHGVFGGLYAPHLRSALLRHLIQAESLLDKLESNTLPPSLRVTSSDFDADGQKEVLLDHPTFGAVIRPGDGGTFSSLRFKPADAELLNSLMRRPEPYHALIRHRATTEKSPRDRLASIHDRVSSKEANLDSLLRYDRYGRHAFRTYVFPGAKQWSDLETLLLEENEELAQGPWRCIAQSESMTVELRREVRVPSEGGDLELRAAKLVAMKAAGETWEIECRSSLSTDRTSLTPLALGVEVVFNLLAPDAPDRYFLANSVRRPLAFRGEIAAPDLVVVDHWQRVRISLTGHPQPRWWISPVETISQSESGFERVYQGSAIMPVWKIDTPSWREITCALRVEIARLSP